MPRRPQDSTCPNHHQVWHLFLQQSQLEKNMVLVSSRSSPTSTSTRALACKSWLTCSRTSLGTLPQLLLTTQATTLSQYLLLTLHRAPLATSTTARPTVTTTRRNRTHTCPPRTIVASRILHQVCHMERGSYRHLVATLIHIHQFMTSPYLLTLPTKLNILK